WWGHVVPVVGPSWVRFGTIVPIRCRSPRGTMGSASRDRLGPEVVAVPTTVESGGQRMGQIAKVTEISARSPEGFQAAIEDAVERANDTLRNVSSAWVKEQHVHVSDG